MNSVSQPYSLFLQLLRHHVNRLLRLRNGEVLLLLAPDVRLALLQLLLRHRLHLLDRRLQLLDLFQQLSTIDLPPLAYSWRFSGSTGVGSFSKSYMSSDIGGMLGGTCGGIFGGDCGIFGGDCGSDGCGDDRGLDDCDMGG